jgi:hypothetical protein
VTVSHFAQAAEQAKAAAREVVDEVSAALVARIEALEAKLDAALGSEPPADMPTGEDDAPAAKVPAKRAASRRKAAPAPEADLPTADDVAE